MLTLNDGRSELWQWDTGRKLTVDADCSQIHFSNKVFGRSIDVDVVDGVAIIPDILLQTDKELTAWAFVGTAENGYTKISKSFKVNRRNKPADYVFTPPEQTALAEIMERLDDLEAIQDPDAIKNAVEDYLEQNPVEVPVESVNGKTGKVNLTATDVGAISQDDLQEATNEALEQAKESGEFDGKDGATFTPSLDDYGNLSWSNDKGLPNPEPKNIRGPQGPAGEVSDDKIAEAVKEYLDKNPAGASVEPAEDDIPKVFFTGDTTGMDKSTAVDLAFEYRSKTATHRGVANVKWQGSSSLSYPEKNYTIKLFTDAAKSEKLKLSMKGWGKENKFCLKANYVDTLHLRNLVGARIAYDMIKSRNDFVSLPIEMQEAPRCGVVDGFPVKVFINGVLQGVYTWNIPKDKWCMNMDDENANHAFLMAEKNNNGNSATTDALVLACEFRGNATIFADTSEAQYPPYDWVVEGPGDDVGTNIRESFNALIDCVKDTDDATFKATIGNHLDLTSAFDYYSFAYLMCHYDGLGKNLGMATYDGVKWFCVLYDMDSTFGAKIDGTAFLATNRKCPEEYQETNSLLWQRIEKCFGAELYARYMELRNGALSLSNILTHAERFYDTIPSEYYAEDKAIWAGKPSQSTNTITRLRNYIVERAAYVDEEMLAIGTTGGGEPDEPPAATLVRISATYSGGAVMAGTPLAYLTEVVVTAEYSDGSTDTITGYTLSGEIVEGENVITVAYEGMTATFAVIGVALGDDGNVLALMTPNVGIELSGASAGELKEGESTLGSFTTTGFIEVEVGAKYTATTDGTWLTIVGYTENEVYGGRITDGNSNAPQTYTGVINYPKIRITCYLSSGSPTYCTLTKE